MPSNILVLPSGRTPGDLTDGAFHEGITPPDDLTADNDVEVDVYDCFLRATGTPMAAGGGLSVPTFVNSATGSTAIRSTGTPSQDMAGLITGAGTYLVVLFNNRANSSNVAQNLVLSGTGLTVTNLYNSYGADGSTPNFFTMEISIHKIVATGAATITITNTTAENSNSRLLEVFDAGSMSLSIAGPNTKKTGADSDSGTAGFSPSLTTVGDGNLLFAAALSSGTSSGHVWTGDVSELASSDTTVGTASIRGSCAAALASGAGTKTATVAFTGISSGFYRTSILVEFDA